MGITLAEVLLSIFISSIFYVMLREIRNAIDHTLANMNEAEDYLAEHAEEISAVDKQNIEAKNQKRQQAINGFIEEKKDEQNA